MAKYRIAWLPGDGVGVDVMEAARLILDKLALDAEYPQGDIGWEFWCKEGDPLPQRTIDLLKQTDCALFGAITSKPKEEAEKELIPELQGKGLVYSSPIVGLRQIFDLGTNMRPCKGYVGNPLNYRDGIDLCVFRENTEDLYSGVEFHPLPKDIFDAIRKHNKKIERFEKYGLDKLAVSLRINSEQASTRIITAAFEYARKFGYKTVTVVEKPNVIRETSGLFVRTARKVAENYSGIELWETNIDAMCMWLIKNPLDYAVLVTSNMFGDIISDLCAQLVGGLGFACSGNIGEKFAVFEPTHGSAPKYAGEYRVNPMAMLLTTKMMLDWLNETDKGEALEIAIARVIKEGTIRTYDMGGSNSTLEVGQAVADYI
jgi:isocitrate/isopropylmalate dehydrogenase